MSAEHVPSAPPRDGQGRQLGIAEIVAAALRNAERHGFGGLTMRGLADELAVTPMAIYYHVANKKVLLELVADEILGGIEIPPPESGNWADRLLELYRATARVLAPYPGVDAMLVDIGLTGKGRRLLDANIQILLDAGFDERTALLAYNVQHAYVVGRTTIESRLRGRPRPTAGAAPDNPALVRIGPHVGGIRSAEYREYAFEVMIAGLRVMRERLHPGTASS